VRRGATVDGASFGPVRVPRNMRRGIHVPALGNEIYGVVILVAPDRHLPINATASIISSAAFRSTVRLDGRVFGIPDQAVAVLHQRISGEAQLGLFAIAFVCQKHVWVSG